MRKNKMPNEGLDFKALKGVLQPTLHIDEFSSKMGGDDEEEDDDDDENENEQNN